MKSALIITLALIQFACVAAAQQQRPDPKEPVEVRFTILDATVRQFPRPLPRRNGEDYREALVVRIAADSRQLDAISPSLQPYLYFGTLELQSWDERRTADGQTIVTFHLPEWQRLREPVPMVLTTLRGDPQRNPRRYLDYPKFDPKLIR